MRYFRIVGKLSPRSLADGALVVLTVLLLVHAGWTMRASLQALSGGEVRRAPVDPARAAKVLAVGHSIPGIDLSGAPQADATMALFFRRDCQYCKASLPFYRELSQLRDKSSGRVRLILAGPDEPGALRDFLVENHIEPDRIQSMSLDTAGVDGTPTLALLDRSGTVRGLWIGQLQPGGREEVLAAIRQSTTGTN